MPFQVIVPDAVIELPTASLRWCDGVLQQAWTIERQRDGVLQSREVEWRAIPTHVPPKPLVIDQLPDWKQDQAETSRLPPGQVTRDNYHAVLDDVAQALNEPQQGE